MLPAKATTPKSFFIWLLSSHKNHGSATAILHGIFDGINGIDGMTKDRGNFWTGLTRLTGLGEGEF
jgi:hypothetical protein